LNNARIVVLGGTGMLGHKIFQILSLRFPETVCTTRCSGHTELLRNLGLSRNGNVIEGVNAMDFDGLRATLVKLRPDFIVNCIGIIKQRPAAQNHIASIAINSLFPHQLAAAAAEWGGRLIHFSTDCVFNGLRGAYSEEDPPDAGDLYGRSKFLGETSARNALTLRTSIIGRELAEHRSLLDWFLSQRAGKVRGFTRVIYSGVTTNHLAEVIGGLIEDHADLSGLYQVASEPISKFDLLCLLRKAYSLSVTIEPDELEVSDRSMKCDKFRRTTGYVCPPWPVLVSQLADDRTPYHF